MKNDARIRYTKMRIHDEFLSLVVKKPVSRITVKEICDRAEINRATFYNHYKDIYDLYEQVQMETIVEFGAIVKSNAFQSHSIEKTICAILENIERGSRDYPILASLREDEMFLKRLTDYFLEEFKEEIYRCYPNSSEEECRLIYKFSAAGTEAAISQWLKDGRKIPVEQTAKLIADRCK